MSDDQERRYRIGPTSGPESAIGQRALEVLAKLTQELKDQVDETVRVERLEEQNTRLLMLAQQAMNAHLLYVHATDEDRNHLATQMDMAIMPFLGMVAADLDATIDP